MEKYTTPAAVRAHSHVVISCVSARTSGFGLEVRRVTAPLAAMVEGTGLSIAVRDRNAVPMTTSLLPISDVVGVFDGLAGSRSWSPPV